MENQKLWYVIFTQISHFRYHNSHYFHLQVAVRLRPMWKKEKDKGEMSIVKILDRNVVILMDPSDVLAEDKVLGKNRSKEK